MVLGILNWKEVDDDFKPKWDSPKKVDVRKYDPKWDRPQFMVEKNLDKFGKHNGRMNYPGQRLKPLRIGENSNI